MVHITFWLFPVPVECTLLPWCLFTPKCFSICFLHDQYNHQNQELNIDISLPFNSQRIQVSVKKHSYYISLVSSFSLKQFINPWPSWPFEDYRLVILQNVFQFGLAFMIISRLYNTERNIKVSVLCFLTTFCWVDHIFFVQLLTLFILWLYQSSVVRIPEVSIHHAFHHWFCAIIQRSLYKACKSSSPFLPLELKKKVVWRKYFKVCNMLLIYLFLYSYVFGLMIFYFIQRLLTNHYHLHSLV